MLSARVLPQQRLIDRVKHLCHTDQRLVAALTYGSFAQDEADAYSDVEFWLFVDDVALATLDGTGAPRRALDSLPAHAPVPATADLPSDLVPAVHEATAIADPDSIARAVAAAWTHGRAWWLLLAGRTGRAVPGALFADLDACLSPEPATGLRSEKSPPVGASRRRLR
ncbi:hypothetical protein AB0G04_26295 [Actinoplanes sp. NPDC023801]|uniref:hypothetical protein n=1 Tax=Actinoplanes sp. NPDC023801 TaxID=3154595 RepID=UPI0033FFD9DE